MIGVDADKHCLERQDIVFRNANFAGELSEGIRIRLVPLDFANSVVWTVTSCGRERTREGRLKISKSDIFRVSKRYYI